MANPTSNFGWQMPTNTDLVKDLPADFEVFGQAVDTSLMDLKGGTTGQVLSKASNTDMDFTWVAQDDSNAIQNAIVDAKGDLITATAADTPARLAVGTDGQYLIADSTTATGLKWGDVSAGAFTELASGTLSGNTVSLTSINQNYRDLVLRMFSPKNANGRSTKLRVNSNSNAIYTGVATYNQFWTGNFNLLNGTDSGEWLNSASTDNNDRFMSVTFLEYANANIRKMGNQTYVRSSDVYYGYFNFNTTSAITSIQIIMSDGESYAGGTYKLYGVK